ncbi:sugar efflux transporter [Streptomyces alboniger]
MTTFALTGAGPGLGLVAARRFGTVGHHVVLLSRDAEHLDALAAELDGDGIRACGFTADVLDPAALTAALAAAAGELGPIEILQFSPVPRGDFMKPVLETTAADLEDPLAFSVKGPLTRSSLLTTRSPQRKRRTPMPSAAGAPAAKLPLVVWVLAAGTFLMGTTEFVIAGLLPQMAGDLGTSVSHADLLITAFAIGMIVGGPPMALATLRLPRRLPRRLTLVSAQAVFALGHVVAALSSSFTVVLAARVVTALATGAFRVVGFVIVTAAAGPARATRAAGVMMGGLTLANVVGVPSAPSSA